MSKNRIIRSEDFSGKAPAIEKPVDIADCAIWLDAQDINGDGSATADAANITSWIDKSGNGRDFINNGVAPVYDEDGFNSLPGVDMNISQGGMRTSGSFTIGANGFTMFFAMNQRGPSGNGFFVFDVDNTVTPRFVAWFNGNVAGGAYFQDAFQATNVNQAGDNVFSITIQAGQFIRRDNSVEVINDSNAVAQQLGPNFTIGDSFSGTSPGNFDGIFSEVIIYDRVLQQFEIEQVEKYLQEKWGI